MKRTRGGEDKVSVAKMPPWSWRPKPLRGSPQSTTSVVSVCTICPPGPTVLEASDTAGQVGKALRGRNTASPSCWSHPTPGPKDLESEGQVSGRSDLSWGQPSHSPFGASASSSVQWSHDSYLAGLWQGLRKAALGIVMLENRSSEGRRNYVMSNAMLS